MYYHRVHCLNGAGHPRSTAQVTDLSRMLLTLHRSTDRTFFKVIEAASTSSRLLKASSIGSFLRGVDVVCGLECLEAEVRLFRDLT
jgi:hypothetical protein